MAKLTAKKKKSVKELEAQNKALRSEIEHLRQLLAGAKTPFIADERKIYLERLNSALEARLTPEQRKKLKRVEDLLNRGRRISPRTWDSIFGSRKS